MAIQPQIAMGFRPPQIESPLNMMSQFAQLQQMQDANALRQAQARKLQLEEERGNALVQALQGGQPTLERLVAADPGRGFEVYKAFQEQQKAQREEAERQQEQMRKRQGTLAQTLFNLRDDPSVDNLARAWQTLNQGGMGEGLESTVAEMLLMTPEQRRAAANQYIKTTPGMAEYIMGRSKEEEDIRKKAMETEKLIAERDVERARLKGTLPTQPQQSELARLLAERNALPKDHPDRKVYDQRIARLGQAPTATATIADKDQGGWMDALRKESDALKSTPGFIASLESARALIPQATTGAGAEVITNVANFARNRLGIEIDPKTVTSEQLRSQLFQGIIANLRQIDAQPTQSQQAALAQAIGTIGSDPKALDKILTFWADLSRARVNEFNRKVDESEKSGFKAPYNPRIKLPEPPSKESLLSPQIKAAIEWAKDPKNANDPTLSAVQDRLRFLGVIE